MAELINVRRISDGQNMRVSRKHWDAALSANPDFELAETPDEVDKKKSPKSKQPGTEPDE